MCATKRKIGSFFGLIFLPKFYEADVEEKFLKIIGQIKLIKKSQIQNEKFRKNSQIFLKIFQFRKNSEIKKTERYGINAHKDTIYTRFILLPNSNSNQEKNFKAAGNFWRNLRIHPPSAPPPAKKTCNSGAGNSRNETPV